MGIKYAELVRMSDEELIEKNDQELGRRQVQTPADLFLGELHRRNMRRHSRTIRNLTWTIAAMTLVVTVATIVNVVG